MKKKNTFLFLTELWHIIPYLHDGRELIVKKAITICNPVISAEIPKSTAKKSRMNW